MASADYRVRIADAGASVVSGNVALTLALADMTTVPVISGPAPNLLGGSSTSMPFDIECLVDTVLFVTSNRLAVIGRLCELQQDLDGAGWVTLATGRINAASELDGRGKVTLSVTDERWVERNTEIFRSSTSVQLHPPGLDSAWKDRSAAGTTTYVVKEISGTDYARLQPFDDEDGNVITQIPAALMDVLRSDLLPSEDRAGGANSAGNFTSLRFRYNSADRTVITFSYTRGILLGDDGSNGPLGTLAAEGRLSDFWVYIAGHGFSVTDTITGRLYFPTGVTPTEDAPLLIGGVAGVHPATLARDVLDGTYGGDAVGYPSALFDDLEAINFLPVWARISEVTDRARWLQRNFYQTFGIPPLVGTDLQLRPTPLRIIPLDLDPDTLPILTAADSGDMSWDHTSSDMVNVVVFKSKDLRPIDPISDRGNTWPVDEYDLIDAAPLRYEHDTLATLGEHVHTIETDLIFQAPGSVARELSNELFDVFGDGAQHGMIRLPDTTAVQVGDLVLIDHDTHKGFNPEDGARTGDRLVRLVGFPEKSPASTLFSYLDVGPYSQPLSAPTVSVVQDGTDLDLINVTISGMAAGVTATVEATADTTTPTSYDHVRAQVGNETVSIRLAASSGTAYVRAYATAPGRIRSAYGTDTVVLTTRPVVTSMRVVKFPSTAQVQWTVSDALGMEVEVGIHARDEDPTFAADVDVDSSVGFYNIANVPPGDVVSVRLTPYVGWTGSAVSGAAGDAVTSAAAFVTKGGFIITDNVAYIVTGAEISFNADGEVVVSAAGADGTANLYVTVGDGTTPSDPTVSTNDGTISGRSGTVDTAVAVTAGNDVTVKVVAADANASLGPVSTFTRTAEARTKVIRIDSAAFQSADDQYTDIFWSTKYVSPTGTLSRLLYAPVNLPIGAVITQVRFRLYMTNTADTFISSFYRVDEDLTTGVTTVGSVTVTGVTGHQWGTIGSLTESVTSSRVYKLRAQLNNNSTSGDCRLGFAEVTYEIPSQGATL